MAKTKTSSAVKQRYNEKAYDRLAITVPKGRKDAIQAAASAQGESLNGFVTTAIDERIERLDGSRGVAKHTDALLCPTCGKINHDGKLIINPVRLKELRKAKGVRQMDVAEFLGISHKSYYRFENGERNFSKENIAKLTEYFDVSVERLTE